MDPKKSYMPDKTKPINKKFKHQYTKPYKDRDRAKDIGKGLPLKKSNRLHFPESPQYYIIHTAKKLTKDNPFFNMFNKDEEAVHQRVKAEREAKRIEEERIKKDSQMSKGTSEQHSDKNSSSHLKNPWQNGDNLYDPKVYSHSYQASRENSRNQKLPFNNFSNKSGHENASSLGIVTISQESRASPFNQGYSVTTGAKNYGGTYPHLPDTNSFRHSLGLSPPNSTLLSNKSVQNISLIDLNQSRSVISRSQGPSV